MEACAQRIVDHERERIAIDRMLSQPGNNDREHLAAFRAAIASIRPRAACCGSCGRA